MVARTIGGEGGQKKGSVYRKDAGGLPYRKGGKFSVFSTKTTGRSASANPPIGNTKQKNPKKKKNAKDQTGNGSAREKSPPRIDSQNKRKGEEKRGEKKSIRGNEGGRWIAGT